MRITLIHNPTAGRQSAGEAARLCGLLAERGHKVRYRSAKDSHWKRALKKPADLVVVAGGDGTVARITRRMVGRGVPLTVLPTGTANNIARTLGLVERPFEELVRSWENPRRVRLDVGVAAGPWGERYFVEGVGAGLFAMLLAQPESEKMKGRAAAVESGLRRLRDQAARCEPVEVAAALDGKDVSGRYVLIEAVNLRYVGPNLHLAPDSEPGDGQFDGVMVSEADAARQAPRDRVDGLRAAHRRQAAAEGQAEAREDGRPGRGAHRRRRGRVPGAGIETKKAARAAFLECLGSRRC